VLRRGGHADRDGHRRVARRGHLLLDRRRETGGELGGALQVLLRQEDAELVAADARGGVDRADRAPERHRDLHQHPVPCLVAVRVVDPLQAVDVHQEHGERVLVALVDVEQDRELALERAQVAEARERVGVGLRLELARACGDMRLHRRRLHRARRLHQRGHRLGEASGVALTDLLEQGADKDALKGGEVARDVGG
jgi:hypothetical protein